MSEFNVNKYKFDDRDREQFLKELKDGLTKEVKAINIFREIINNSVIENPEVIYVGSKEEGQVIFNREEVANVDLFPDYLLKYKKHRRIRFNLIEVKTCINHSEFVYIKKKQVEQYDELDYVVILFVMGISTNNPSYILVSPRQILDMGIEPELIYGKETFKCHTSLFNWDKFEPIKRKYSILEKSYIKE